MTPKDAAKLLALIATYDGRNFDELTAAAWADALDGLEVDDCAQAVRRYFQRSRQWLMPVDVREGVRTILRDRLAAEVRDRLANTEQPAIDAPPLPDPETVAQRAEVVRRAIAEANKMPAVESPHPQHDSKLEMRARQIACPWCGSAPGEACTNTATKQRSLTTHARRLEAVLEPAS